MNRKFNDMHILKLQESEQKKELTKVDKELKKIESKIKDVLKIEKEVKRIIKKFPSYCKLDSYPIEEVLAELGDEQESLICLKQGFEHSLKFIRAKRSLKRKSKF